MSDPQIMIIPVTAVYRIINREFYLTKGSEVLVLNGKVYVKKEPEISLKGFPAIADKGNVHFDNGRWINDNN